MFEAIETKSTTYGMVSTLNDGLGFIQIYFFEDEYSVQPDQRYTEYYESDTLFKHVVRSSAGICNLI